jgi:undecaprenyl-diphosphatase
MTYLQAVVLGLVQGITEFLPISSSGHLVLTPFFFGWDIPPKEAFLFDILSQVATLIAVIAFFWTDLVLILKATWRGVVQRNPFADRYARLGWLLLLASVPAGGIGLLFKDGLEQIFSNPGAVAIFLLLTAVLLVLAERFGDQSRNLDRLTWKDAVWIGLFQGLALLPGISRSGATITGGMTRGLDRASAARFSFLMAVPIMIGAGLSASFDLFQIPNLSTALPPMLVGFLTAAVTGYASIRWLIGYLTRRPVTVFAFYCVMISGITLLKIYLT